MNNYNGQHKQRGVTLIEMMLVIGIMAVITVISFFEKRLDMEQTQARTTGVLLFEYNNAVRSWVSMNVGAPSGLRPEGTAWLKEASCGGTSSIAYLPCSFPDMTSASPVRFGQTSITSNVVTTGVAPNQVTTVTSTTSSFRVLAGNTTVLRTDLGGLAALIAAAGGANNLSPTLASTDGSVNSNPATGIITLVASNNGASDAWLRTDGSNTMNSNITYRSTNPANLRTLTNVSRIQALTTEALYLGGAGGAAANRSVIVDANEVVLGNLVVSNGNAAANGIEITNGSLTIANGNAQIYGDANITGHAAVSEIMANPFINPNMRLLASSFTFSDMTGSSASPVPLLGYVDVSNLNVLTTSGKKISLRHLLPSWVHKSSWYAFDTQQVSKPTCEPGGIPRIIVTPQTIPTNLSAPASGYSQSYRAVTYAYAVDFGANWQVRVYPLYSNVSMGSAVVATYCAY